MSEHPTNAPQGAVTELSNRQCWEYVFAAFGGESRTPPSVDRHPEVAEAVRKAHRDGRAAAPAWLPIESAPSGVLVVVGWRDGEDAEHPDRQQFDWLEDGCWQNYDEFVEWAEVVGKPPGTKMPSTKAPFTHWMPLPPVPDVKP